MADDEEKIVRCPAPCGCVVDVKIVCPGLSQDEINRGCEPPTIDAYGAAVSMVATCLLHTSAPGVNR